MLTNISVTSVDTKLTANLYSFGHYERLDDSWGKEGRIQKEKMQIMGGALTQCECAE